MENYFFWIAIALSVFPLLLVVIAYQKFYQTRYYYYHYFFLSVILMEIFSIGAVLIFSLDLSPDVGQILFNSFLGDIFLLFLILGLILDSISISPNRFLTLIGIFLSIMPISIIVSKPIEQITDAFSWGIIWNNSILEPQNIVIFILLIFNIIVIMGRILHYFIHNITNGRSIYVWYFITYVLFLFSVILDLISSGITHLFPLIILFLSSLVFLFQYFQDSTAFSIYKGELLYLMLIYKNGLPMFDYDFQQREIVSLVPQKSSSVRFAHIRYLLHSSSVTFEVYAEKSLKSGKIQDFDIKSFNICVYSTMNVQWILISQPNAHNHFKVLKWHARLFEGKFPKELAQMAHGVVATKEMKEYCRKQWEKL
ncbi:MAG: hypothetical protein ACTSUK_09390 [Promethearchaeota archaeon]